MELPESPLPSFYQLDQERQTRLTAALAAIQQRYDSADDQEALRRFEVDLTDQQGQTSGQAN